MVTNLLLALAGLTWIPLGMRWIHEHWDDEENVGWAAYSMFITVITIIAALFWIGEHVRFV